MMAKMACECRPSPGHQLLAHPLPVTLHGEPTEGSRGVLSISRWPLVKLCSKHFCMSSWVDPVEFPVGPCSRR